MLLSYNVDTLLFQKQTFSKIFCLTSSGIQSAVSTWNLTSAFELTVIERPFSTEKEPLKSNKSWCFICNRLNWFNNLYWHADHQDHCFYCTTLSGGLQWHKPGEKDISYCFNLKQLRVNIVSYLFTYQLERQFVRPVRVKCQINIDIW